MNRRNNENDVIDAEVVEETIRPSSSSSYSGHGSGGERYSAGSANFGGTRFTYFSTFGPSQGSGGLSTVFGITVGLFLAVFLKWGFLAGLGFLFFYGIATSIGMYCSFRAILSGRAPNRWAWRIGAWVVSLLLVASLV